MGKAVLFILISSIFCFLSFNWSGDFQDSTVEEFDFQQSMTSPPTADSKLKINSEEYYDSIFNANPVFEAEGFDFPIGKPDALNYFNAQTFGKNRHLGEDWNGNGGGNTDLGDPVFATADGIVSFSKDVCCGWGNTVKIIHKLPKHAEYNYVESLYAHLHNINVKNGELIKRGQQIGTIGTAHGRYSAHLHFEMRDVLNMPIGQGYSADPKGYFAPTAFIRENRPLGE